MFDSIFNNWIDTNQLNQEDVVELLLEWDKEFHEGNLTPQQIVTMLTQDPRMQFVDLGAVLTTILTVLGVKRGRKWITVTKDNVLIKRFRYD